MNERIVNLPGAFIPMAKARGLQAQSLVIRKKELNNEKVEDFNAIFHFFNALYYL